MIVIIDDPVKTNITEKERQSALGWCKNILREKANDPNTNFYFWGSFDKK